MKPCYGLLIVALLGACKSDKEKPSETYLVFSDSTSGWTTQYPETWPAMSSAEIAKMEGRGQDAMENAAGQDIELTHTNLLWLKKDDFNSLTSNHDPFDSLVDGSFEENEKAIQDVLELTYRQNGLKFETSTGKETIDGLEFSTFETTLFMPNGTDTLMRQVIWSRLLSNKLSLTLNINSNNPADRATLMNIIRTSKFSIRD